MIRIRIRIQEQGAMDGAIIGSNSKSREQTKDLPWLRLFSSITRYIQRKNKCSSLSNFHFQLNSHLHHARSLHFVLSTLFVFVLSYTHTHMPFILAYSPLIHTCSFSFRCLGHSLFYCLSLRRTVLIYLCATIWPVACSFFHMTIMSNTL